MSRSCHSGDALHTGMTWARTTRASPQIRSDLIGFFLCGIAEEPFWPLPNGSASSRTSVRCPCRTSSATASQTEAVIASTLTHSEIPSRNTTWLATGAGRSPRARHDLGLDSRVDVGVGAHRARTACRRPPPPGAQQPVTAAGHGEGEVGHPVAPDVGLGVDAVRPPGPQRAAVRQRVVAEHAPPARGLGQQQVGRLGELDGERGVEQVGRGHAEVHVRRGLARRGVVGPGAEEGDHVVVGHRLEPRRPRRATAAVPAGPAARSRRARCRPAPAPPAPAFPPGSTARTCARRSRSGPSRAACTARS